MQKNNTVLMVIIALILFLPSSSAKSETVKTWLDNTNKYELLSNEGFVAFEVNETEVKNKEETVVKCECEGTGKIRTGDNRILPCPCGDNCTCSKKVNNNSINLTIKDVPTVEETQKKSIPIQVTEPIEKDYLVGLEKRCLLFTNTEWCAPCRQLEKSTLIELKKAGYEFDLLDKPAHITVLDETHPLYSQLKLKALPTFVFVKNGKVIKTMIGYYTSNVISDEFNRLMRDE